MCGLLLIKSKKINNHLKSNFLKSLNFMKNRGPDESSYISNKEVLIGFNRLSINNIKNGQQPFRSKCGRYILVFNGEIVNYKRLELHLTKKGIKINNASEIEIIFEFYKIYKEKCVNFFKGFFAIVIYDNKKKNYFCSSR